MYHGNGRTGRMVGPRELVERYEELDESLLREAHARFPVQVTRSWLRRMGTPDDALGRQTIPVPAELEDGDGDVSDPVGEAALRPHPWLVQKHPDRMLLLLTRRCHLYCRYCFRRDQEGARDPSLSELDEALVIAKASGARELILSGGDPLAVADSRLAHVLASARPELPIVRVHTRAPITAPWRVTEPLVALLRAHAPLWVVVHCNHPDELNEEVDTGLSRLVDAGVPVLNQAVLLRGVNDDVDVLVRLSEALMARRVFPYYLHHPDPVPGSAAFRLDLERGLALHDALRGRVSGLALPRYVIDRPDGSGKVDVATWLRGTPAVLASQREED